MRVVLALAPALLGVVAASVTPMGAGLLSSLRKREELETCSGLTISENNGDRKGEALSELKGFQLIWWTVVIVVDSSGSMTSNDRGDLRLSAAHALNAFLISKSEASGGRKADQVAVISFDTTAETVFAPGDPGDPSADQAIAAIPASGGTNIGSGILEAIDNIAAMSGSTKDRSAIVVYTDGSDSSTTKLVSAIKNATALGIRVSFGFLDDRISSQPKEVLLAVRESKGVYATIAVAAGSINFVNYVLLNGLSSRDNPQGTGDRLLAGLASTQVISGSGSVTMRYFAEKGERANFTLVSFTGSLLNMEAQMGGKKLNSTDSRTTARKVMEVVPPSTGEMDIVIRASDSPKDGLFSVVTGSSAPIKNCTVGVTGGNNTGLSTGAKAGIGVGAVAALLGLGGMGFMAYQHLLTGGNTTAAPVGGNTTAPALVNGQTIGYQGGGEKLGPQTTSTAIPPNHTGFEGTMADQPVPPTGGEMPSPNALHPAVPPFVPPPMPPMPPSNTADHPTTSHNGHQGPLQQDNQHQPSLGGQTGYQQPINGQNYHQSSLGTGGNLYNHTGSPFQGNSTGTPHVDPNSGAYSTPNHTGFDGTNNTSYNTGNHTEMGPPDQSYPPVNVPGFPGPTPPQPFFGVPPPPARYPGTGARKHHHHEWLAPDAACDDPRCPLISAAHRCSPSSGSCTCTCRNANCAATSRGL